MSSPYLFFWKSDYENGWLSNWSEHRFLENGIEFKTAEHYLMYHKAMLMGDEACAKQILTTRTPRAAKELGKCVMNWDESKWCEAREDIMLRGLRLKVYANPELKTLLLDTGTSVIAEASPFDKVWGIGVAESNHRAREPTYWVGRNLLGKVWMKLRDEIRSQNNDRS
jgi:ribA/ribD-fused uncharacterized protein